MPDLTILITQAASLTLPTSMIGWFGWFAFLAVIILLNLNWKSLNQQWDTRGLVLLMISIPISTLFLPSLEIGIGGLVVLLPLFGAVPWLLAAGFYGPGLAAGMAFLSGLLIAVWGGFSLFLPLELAVIATGLGWMFSQEYRTPFYRGLRHPIVSSLLVALVFPLIYMVSTILQSQGSIGMRLTLGLENLVAIFLNFGLFFLVAGMIGEVFAFTMKIKWGSQGSKRPSPAEKKLSTRFLISVVPLSIFLLVVLIFSAWTIAGRVARELLEGRMSSAAEMTAQSIPFYLETGQNLLLRLANEPLYEMTGEEIHGYLAVHRREIPYFSQLFYLDQTGELITSEPNQALSILPISPEEYLRINAASVVPFDLTAVSSGQESNAAMLSFVAGVKDQAGELRGVLVGRSDLAANPFSRPLITGIESLSVLDGNGMLVDDNGFILYHTDPDMVMSTYEGNLSTTSRFIEEISSNGDGELVYVHPVTGKPWSVIVKVPSRYIQQQAVNFALPLIGIITILVIIAGIIFRYSLRSITASLEELAVQANRMARGELDQAIEVKGEDEVGQLRFAFEQMRSSLKSRLDELNRLLFVSQGIAATIKIEEVLERVLESALDIGANSARIYLHASILPNARVDETKPLQMGFGPAADEYSYLDEQVSGLTERQPVLKLNNLTRPKIFSNPGENAPPLAILALALLHDNKHYGSFWVAFDHPHRFTDEEVRYTSTLAGQAVLAVENSRLFLTSEIGRQRLASVLDSTPDPVLVTDQNENLVVLNSAARRIFEFYDEEGFGKPISHTISQKDLMELFQPGENNIQPREIIFDDGKVYLASISPVKVEGIAAGRVCVLRDVTAIKELNSSKSDFVSTVSHDLRSPLALIQGYTSMLQMVGDLNEQQESFLKKISDETEKISHLVTNLLDLGRIEADVGLHLEKKPVNDVVERVVAAAQIQADQKRITLSTEIQQVNLPTVEADQALLQQALYNLVDNAIKFTESGGEVTIRLRATEDKVVYAVVDTGIGISPADQQSLFDKFFRASSKHGLDNGGSGLGLAIAHSIAVKHNGNIEVESKLGRGSTFYLELPLRQARGETIPS